MKMLGTEGADPPGHPSAFDERHASFPFGADGLGRRYGSNSIKRTRACRVGAPGVVQFAEPWASIIDVGGPTPRILEADLRAKLEPGWREVSWRGPDAKGHRLGAGIYFVRFCDPEAGDFRLKSGSPCRRWSTAGGSARRTVVDGSAPVRIIPVNDRGAIGERAVTAERTTCPSRVSVRRDRGTSSRRAA